MEGRERSERKHGWSIYRGPARREEVEGEAAAGMVKMAPDLVCEISGLISAGVGGPAGGWTDD